MIRKIEIERFSLTTSKAFNEVIAGVNAAIGHPDMAEFGRSTHEARSLAELKSAVEKGLSKVGLMLRKVLPWPLGEALYAALPKSRQCPRNIESRSICSRNARAAQTP